MTTVQNDVAQLADTYIDAYNRKDLEAVVAMLASDVHIIHHNRGVEVTGPEAARALYEGYGAAFPDRAFTKRRDVLVNGDTVIVRHTWGGTAAADVPGWATTGDAVSLDVTTFLTFRDGVLVEYEDFG